jgi:Uma2 family endonuclease
MRTVVIAQPPHEIEVWLEDRRAKGQDLFDEVWEGEYHVAPAPHPRHGELDDQIATLLRPRARRAGLLPVGPLNIGDPDNYRVPDRAYLRERYHSAFVRTVAIVVEIVSPGDETYDKFGFYFDHGVDEILVVDGTPGAIEWYGRGERSFERRGASNLLSLTEDELTAEIDWPPAD